MNANNVEPVRAQKYLETESAAVLPLLDSFLLLQRN